MKMRTWLSIHANGECSVKDERASPLVEQGTIVNADVQ